MNTTNLFVELIVIGVGTGLWLTLLLFALFGYYWLPPIDSSLVLIASIPSISIIYVLGIVSDRLIDKIYDNFDIRFLKDFYKDDKKRNLSEDDLKDVKKLKRIHHEERRKVINSHERMAEMIEYNRSRLRICRGWSVNALLIAFTLPFFAIAHLPRNYALNVSIVGFVGFLVLSISCHYTWVMLNDTLYKKTNEQYYFILAEEKKKPKSS
jgi:hypothetical protein